MKTPKPEVQQRQRLEPQVLRRPSIREAIRVLRAFWTIEREHKMKMKFAEGN